MASLTFYKNDVPHEAVTLTRADLRTKKVIWLKTVPVAEMYISDGEITLDVLHMNLFFAKQSEFSEINHNLTRGV